MPTAPPAFLWGSVPVLSWGFKHDEEKLLAKWLNPKESTSLRDVGMGRDSWPQLDVSLHRSPDPRMAQQHKGEFYLPSGTVWLLCI